MPNEKKHQPIQMQVSVFLRIKRLNKMDHRSETLLIKACITFYKESSSCPKAGLRFPPRTQVQESFNYTKWINWSKFRNWTFKSSLFDFPFLKLSHKREHQELDCNTIQDHQDHQHILRSECIKQSIFGTIA